MPFMAHVLFGCSSADLALTQGGVTAPGAGPFSVFTTGPDRATSVAVTDLKDLADNAISTVTFDSDGFLRFKAPDSYPVLWLDTGVGLRVAVRPVNLTGPKGDKGDTGNTGPAGPAIGALLTTKGDLAVHNGTAAVREPVGTNGQVLLADSAQADGIRWASLGPGNVTGAYQALATNTTLTAADSLVAVDTTAGAVTLTLPAASAMTGRGLRIVKTGGANTLTVQRAGSDLILPGSKTSIVFPSDCAMGEIEVASSGTGWRVVSGQASDESVGSRFYRWSQALAASGTGATVGWALNARQITDGLGSPEGFVSASPGASYTQVNHSVGGVLVWRKRTGTGTTGWVVVEGDTGLRPITPETGFAAAATTTIRRDGGMTTLTAVLQRQSGVLLVNDAPLVLPPGFRPDQTRFHVPCADSTGKTVTISIGTSDGVVKVVGVTAGVSAYLYINASFHAETAWPSAAPV